MTILLSTRDISRSARAPIFHVAQPKRNRNAIKAEIDKRQSHRIGKNGVPHTFAFRQLEHLSQEISADDFCIRQFCLDGERKVSSAGCKITITFAFQLATICAARFANEDPLRNSACDWLGRSVGRWI